MKAIRYTNVINGRKYKDVPIVVMSNRELNEWDVKAEEFYKMAFNDLEFMVEPYKEEYNNGN